MDGQVVSHPPAINGRGVQHVPALFIVPDDHEIHRISRLSRNRSTGEPDVHDVPDTHAGGYVLADKDEGGDLDIPVLSRQGPAVHRVGDTEPGVGQV